MNDDPLAYGVNDVLLSECIWYNCHGNTDLSGWLFAPFAVRIMVVTSFTFLVLCTSEYVWFMMGRDSPVNAELDYGINMIDVGISAHTS